MLIAGITIEDVREVVKAGKDIGLIAYSVVKMLQAGITYKNLKLFLDRIGIKLAADKAVLLLINRNSNILIPRIYDFMDRLVALRMKHREKIKKEGIPKYLLEVALLLESLNPEQYSFRRICNEMEAEILFPDKDPRSLFENKYFPLYLKSAKEFFGKKLLLFGRRHFRTTTEVFVAAWLSDAIYGNRTLEETLADRSVPLPSDLVILKNVVEKVQQILSPAEYDGLIKYFSEYKEGDKITPHIQSLIVKIREGLSLEIEEEEMP